MVQDLLFLFVWLVDFWVFLLVFFLQVSAERWLPHSIGAGAEIQRWEENGEKLSPSVETFTAPTGPLMPIMVCVLCFDFPVELQPWKCIIKFLKHEGWGASRWGRIQAAPSRNQQQC